MSAVLIWLRLEYSLSYEFLWRFRFHKRWGIPYLAKWMLPSQGVFCIEIIVAFLEKQVDSSLSYRYVTQYSVVVYRLDANMTGIPIPRKSGNLSLVHSVWTGSNNNRASVALSSEYRCHSVGSPFAFICCRG